MQKSRLKSAVLIIVFILLFAIIQMPTYATNENITIKLSEKEYIIYLKEYLGEKFEFAFSNNKLEDISNLKFNVSAVDNPETENRVAYVNDETTLKMFDKDTYMWIRVNGDMKVSAQKISIKNNIAKADLEAINNVSKNMPVKIEQEQTINEINQEGVKITETLGIVKLSNETQTGEYQLVKRSESQNNERLFYLAELIEKNQFQDIYTKLEASKEFSELLNLQFALLNENDWKIIENSTIYQPQDAQNGDQYIIWLRDGNNNDVHFLTSIREYSEDYVKQKVEKQLPYTYDNNIILFVLGIVIILIIVVVVRIFFLKKNKRDEN